MFRSNSISVLLLALAICAAGQSRCLAQVKAGYLPLSWSFAVPDLPTPKGTVESSGGELENPFDPFPDGAEIAELDSILATWDRVFSEQPFNTRRFRQWRYDKIFGPTDPDQYKEYREGVVAHTTAQRWSMRELEARGYPRPRSAWDDLVLIPNFFGPRPKTSDEVYEPRLSTSEWAWDGESLGFWSSNKSNPIVAPARAEDCEPPFVAVLAFCGNGQARELAHRYWMRVVSRASAEEQPRLEMRPRLKMDVGSWKEMTILLASDQTPSAVEIIQNNNHRTVFEFTTRTNAWWPDERRFTEMARLRQHDEELKKAPKEQPAK